MYEVEERYYEWLLKEVSPNGEDQTYRSLTRYLFYKPFCWTYPMDENRAKDGWDMRTRFAYEEDFGQDDLDHINDFPNYLEVLVALAYRCSTEIISRTNGSCSPEIFWHMMRSSGLWRLDDYNWSEFQADLIIQNIMYHEFEKNGQGGLFTTVNEKIDMRKLQIWYQLQNYLIDTRRHGF